ncbi:MAG: PEP-CTERM sorting domain-containing protein [Opitutaceae bacterium]|nr:PEP-CTERM sorting domain-containing protein [Opitutaceae bacterium]
MLDVGSGGLSIGHDGNAATRNAFTLLAASTGGTLLLNGNVTFNNATASTSKVQITRGVGAGYIDLGGGDRTFTINDGGAAEDLEVTVRMTNGGLIKQGAGVLALANTPSDYAGNTVINQGTIRVTSATVGNQALSNQSTVVLADVAGVTLDLNGNNQAVGGLSGGGVVGGAVTLGAGTLTVGNNNASTSFGGEISGAGGLTKTGTGTLTLSSDLGYTGATLVSNGTLVVDGQLASSGVTLDGATAVLGGSGRVNSLTLTQGTFAPGNSPGTFTADGNVSFGAASVFAIEAGSISSFDQLVVTGATSVVSIVEGASLSVTGVEAFDPLTVGTEFIFIDNQSANPITGTFSGVGEGQSFLLGANNFTASYQLGVDGNDFGFIVTAIPEPSSFAMLAGLASLAFASRRRRA